ncbi:AMP-binding protein [Idiomarina piscisalsi]|uniref:AMP-binding enzyme n=1 Tax=Idiomarina piscisalsi TaxID=1096243 RepID=UPI001384A285|nr:AMP-binding protein [Idiomarina piscisalsi]MTJ02733.1 AMP-binding protein [Idiomarina piscisalsi]
MSVNLKKPALVQLIGDLIAEELTRLRPAESDEWRRRRWLPTDELVPQSKATGEATGKTTDSAGNEIVVDSLEWMAIAGRVVQFFQMEESGIEDYLLRKNRLDEWSEIVQKARDIASNNITVTTSGSTGQPKPCRHPWAQLTGEADYFAELISTQNTSVQRVITLVPSHHIYGLLFSVLLPDILDVPVIRGFSAFQQVTGGSLQPGDLVIGFPEALTQATKLLSHIPNEVTFTTSSGPCPAETINALYEAGASRVIEIYGSSETAGIGYRFSPEQPFLLLPRWQQESINTLQEKHTQQSYELPDKLNWLSDKSFIVSERVDSAVVIKGTNVYPSRVMTLIESHPAVSAAAVRQKKPAEGKGLKAFVVLKNHSEKITEADLKHWLSERLLDIEVPTHITFGDAIPANEIGKQQDWSL